MSFPSSGLPQVDTFLARGYGRIRGMSSRFAASICAWLITHQSSQGVTGGLAEIGSFEGRFLFALAMALPKGEPAIGIDSFDWPSPAVEDRFKGHAARLGLKECVTAWKADSRTIRPPELLSRLGNRPARFIHIDGEHSPEALSSDLALAVACLHPQGLICLDDMLHPAYPFLAGTVETFLKANRDWRLMAILDREDIVAAAKFLLCRVEAVPLYEGAMMAAFPKQHFVLGGDALGHHCVVLTPKPRLAKVD